MRRYGPRGRAARPAGPWTYVIWGLAAAATYLAAAAWTGGVPAGRVLYDGFAPLPPYRWIRPPANFPHENERPESGAGSIALTSSGSEPRAVVTDDDQAAVVFMRDVVAPRTGEASVRVTLTPLDPGALPSPPAGMRFDGNAYRISATYGVSQAPAVLRKPVNVILRFPTTGTQLLRSTGTGWTVLSTTTLPPAMQDVADSEVLGIFIAASPPGTGLSVSALLYRALTILLWAAAAVLFVGLLRDYARQHPRRGRPHG